MDTLKGKQIMVWTFMGNARMYEASGTTETASARSGCSPLRCGPPGKFTRAAWRFRICSPTSTSGPISSGC